MEEVHRKLFPGGEEAASTGAARSPGARARARPGEPRLALWGPVSPERKTPRRDELRAAEAAVARSRLVQGLTPSEIARLVAQAALLEARCGQCVLSAMEKADDALVVLAGTFAVATPGGAELQRVGPESTVGDISMLMHDIRHITVTCVSADGKCLRIGRRDYQACLGLRYTTFMTALMLTLERGLAVTCPYVNGPPASPTGAQEDEEDEEEGDGDDEEGPEDLGLGPQTLAISRYIRQRRVKLAKLGVDCMSVPDWEEVCKFWHKVPERERVRLYFEVKALAQGAWSNGYCPHFDMPADALDERSAQRAALLSRMSVL
jgi:hypothetical protein